MGVPVGVSIVDPYRGFPDDIVNYVNTHQDWYRHVRRLTRDRGLAAEQGARLHQYCDVMYNFNRINEARCRMITGKE
jgi:hypothetical protein